MSKLRPSTKAERTAKEPATVPAKFVPRFWELDADKRQTRTRLIRRCIDELCEHANADSMQKRMLVERAVFLALQCQTIEIDSYEGRDVDLKRIAVHCQLSNALSGILSKLKLDKAKFSEVLDLDAYVASKSKARS